MSTKKLNNVAAGLNPSKAAVNKAQRQHAKDIEYALLATPQKQPLTTDQILEERGSRYGSFLDNSRISQDIKAIIRRENENRIKRVQRPLQYHQLEALEMMATKMCRILSGDAEYVDNWDDIAGYAQLGKNPR